jgi:hypothetical protein
MAGSRIFVALAKARIGQEVDARKHAHAVSHDRSLISLLKAASDRLGENGRVQENARERHAG